MSDKNNGRPTVVHFSSTVSPTGKGVSITHSKLYPELPTENHTIQPLADGTFQIKKIYNSIL